MPRVSVIVPNYNHARFLRQRLDSIFNQTFTDFEVILLDDCSTDNSREILDQYRNHSKVSAILFNEKNSGSSFKQWRKGIKIAKGELIWIAESDDYCVPSFLEKMMISVNEHPDALIFASNLNIVDNNNNQLDNRKTHYVTQIWKGDKVIKKNFMLGNYLWNASALIFRKEAVNFCDWNAIEKMRFCGDWLFYVMVLMHGNLVTDSEYLCYFRNHKQTVSSSPNSKYLRFSEGLKVVEYIAIRYRFNFYSKVKLSYKWMAYLNEAEIGAREKSQISFQIKKMFGFVVYFNALSLSFLAKATILLGPFRIIYRPLKKFVIK